MTQITTFVGIDAHKKDLFVAMLSGPAAVPVTWQLANEPGAVRRWGRKSPRAGRLGGRGAGFLRAGRRGV